MFKNKQNDKLIFVKNLHLFRINIFFKNTTSSLNSSADVFLFSVCLSPVVQKGHSMLFRTPPPCWPLHTFSVLHSYLALISAPLPWLFWLVDICVCKLCVVPATSPLPYKWALNLWDVSGGGRRRGGGAPQVTVIPISVAHVQAIKRGPAIISSVLAVIF